MTVDLTRKTSWDADLNTYLDSMRAADELCSDFAAMGIEAMTGVDLRVKFRGRLAWARDHLAEAMDEVLQPRPVAFARAGDLVMKDGNLGLCNGEVSFFMGLHEGQTGTATVSTLECDKAWTVG